MDDIAGNAPRFRVADSAQKSILITMADRQIPKRIFPEAKEDAASARAATPLPQTADPAYRLAYTDVDFLMRDDLRPVRFQLELLKPELLLDEAGIGSTFVFYGSARIPSPEHAELIVAAAKTGASNASHSVHSGRA